MEGLFLKLLNMSISASWLVLIVIAARFLLKNAPKSIRCVLWALVAVRLLCPVSIESSLSLIPSTETVTRETDAIQPAASPGTPVVTVETSPSLTFDSGVEFLDQTAGTAIARSLTPAVGDSADPGDMWLFAASIVWIIGMAVLLLYALWSCNRIRKKVAASIPIGDSVYICDYIDSPFILGIIRPKIYLPSELNPESAAYVLAHERAHLKRRDHWWKPLGFLLLTVYWFNPLIWAAYILLCRDIELACDERVIQQMGSSDKKAYSEALLSCSVPRHMIAACPLAFGEVGVKERVKSVLNYKKPAFWIVVIAVIICVAVAVCFLTDPKPATLADFADISPSDLTEITVSSFEGQLSLTNEEEFSPLFKLLEQVEYDPTPISDERREEQTDEYGWNYPVIQFTCGESQYTLFFTYDYTEVWFHDGVKPTKPYRVENPEILTQYIEDYVTPVATHTAAGVPFATLAEPYKWMQGITTDVVKIIRVYYNQTGEASDTTFLANAYFEQLTDILHRIPEDALSKRASEAIDGNSLRCGKSSESPQITFVINDNANGLSAALRLLDGQVQLLLLDGTDWPYYNYNAVEATVWNIYSEELLAFLSDFAQNPPKLQLTGGALGRYDIERARASVTWGNVTIESYRLTDWDYEIVEYAEGAESFGIRCRPKSETEGWLYCSFWPGGYNPPAEEDRYYDEYNYGIYSITSWPSAVKTKTGIDTAGFAYSYSLTEYPTGDYVFINEGADSWLGNYSELGGFNFFTQFSYGKTDYTTNVTTYGNVTVDFGGCLDTCSLPYFDWEFIAGEMGAEELYLFDAQEADGMLFVGCQNGEEYTIAVFRALERGGYAYVKMLSGSDIRYIEADEENKLPYSTYETENASLYLYLLTNEDVTVVTFYGDFVDYMVTDHFPALVVRDMTGIESFQATRCNFDYEEPVVLYHCPSPLRNFISFAGEENESQPIWQLNYIRSASAWFYDGTTYPGWFSLTHDEILQLRDRLVALTEDQFTPIEKEEMDFSAGEDQRYISLYVPCSDGILNSNHDWSMELTRVNGIVYLYFYLWNNQTGSNQREFCFALDNPELTAFLEALCDSTRTESTVHYNTTGYTLEESYVEYVCDYASFRIRQQAGWEYEIVEYADDDTPFGIRCRPEWAEEGWLFLSYWPSGFEPDDTGRYVISQTEYTESYAEKPSQDDRTFSWSYRRMLNLPGDYVILNEGAESWLELDNAYWFIYSLLNDTVFGEDIITKTEAIQIVRELSEQDTGNILRNGYINTTASNLELNFDFHTGLWNVLIPVKDTDDQFIQLQLDSAGNWVSTLIGYGDHIQH